MKKFRLYTSDVEDGITDFNDDSYIIIHESKLTPYSLILDTEATFNPFIVANHIHYRKYNSIEWNSGTYFANMEDAYIFIRKKEIEQLQDY